MQHARSCTKARRGFATSGLEGSINIRTSKRDSSLRAHLRTATSGAHAQLDDAFDPARFGDRASYAGFLQFQLAARRPIEAWLADHCPALIRPPQTIALIERDLQALDVIPSLKTVDCALGDTSDPLGVAWVLAGSSMGNRAMLAVMAKSGVSSMPTAFLSDLDMPRFWQELRPLLERHASVSEAAPAIASANAAFAMFAKGLERVQGLAA